MLRDRSGVNQLSTAPEKRSERQRIKKGEMAEITNVAFREGDKLKGASNYYV